MAQDKRDESEQAGKPDRRSVLAGTAASVATAAMPKVALARDEVATSAKSATSGGVINYGAVYMDPRYLETFNDHAYSEKNVSKVHDLILRMFPNRSDLKWGLYQQAVEPDPTKWGSTSAYTNWPDFSQEARDDLEKQEAKFTDPKNAMDPFDTTKVAANLVEHLDEVVRIALWDRAVPLKINVGRKAGRHHGLTTEWSPAPKPGANPQLQLTGLTINIDCPQEGWEGYAIWRNQSTSDQITKFAAKWKVPQAPSSNDGQIIFIFNGVESITGPAGTGGILQPVLQWTRDGWYVRSWYVTADFSITKHPDLPDVNRAVGQDHLADENRCYSVAVKVNTGQTILGVIQGGKDANGKFNYTCSVDVDGQHKAETELPFADIPEPIYAVCVVESYKVQLFPPRAPDYPPDPITLSSIDLQVGQKPVSPIYWKTNKKSGFDYLPTASGSGDEVEFKLI